MRIGLKTINIDRGTGEKINTDDYSDLLNVSPDMRAGCIDEAKRVNIDYM